MKRSCTSLAISALFAMSAGIALAGDPPPPPAHDDAPPAHLMRHGHRGPPSAEDMTRHMQKDLGLSEEQVTKLRSINESHVAQMERIRSEHQAALREVLTPEQYATLQKHHEEREMRTGEHHHGDAPH